MFAGDFAHFRPRGVRIDFFHHGRERAAASNGDAQIVNGIGIGGGVQLSKLFQNAVHPVRKTAVFALFSGEWRNCGR